LLSRNLPGRLCAVISSIARAGRFQLQQLI
jgi:hypothetical protein